MANSLNDGMNRPSQLDRRYAAVYNGSPSAGANIVQTGQGISTAGSLLNITFGAAFLGTPRVQVTQYDGQAVVTAGSVGLTGFTVLTAGGSKTVDWLAIGSGASW